MSVRMTDLVWSRAPYKSEKLLAILALADWADDAGFCRVSLRHLAIKARVTKSAVVKILQKFQRDNAIILVSKGGGRGNSSVYKLLYQNWQKRPLKKGVAGLPFEGEKGIPATPFIETEKGISTIPFVKKKGIPATPISEEKGQPGLPFSPEKGVPEAGAYKELNTHGVCVDISQEITHTTEARRSDNSSGKTTLSRHSFETIFAYTSEQQKQGAKIDPVAVAMAREKDGKLDAVIDQYLAKIAEQESASIAEMPGKPVPELLEELLRVMSGLINAKSFDSWFKPIQEMTQTENKIYLRVPSQVFKDWIVCNYAGPLGEALEEVGLAAFYVELFV
jgi:hypothetical protein